MDISTLHNAEDKSEDNYNLNDDLHKMNIYEVLDLLEGMSVGTHLKGEFEKLSFELRILIDKIKKALNRKSNQYVNISDYSEQKSNEIFKNLLKRLGFYNEVLPYTSKLVSNIPFIHSLSNIRGDNKQLYDNIIDELEKAHNDGSLSKQEEAVIERYI